MQVERNAKYNLYLPDQSYVVTTSSGKLFPYVTMFNFSVETYYQLEFKIRDGRVRVSAPIAEDNGNMTGVTKGPSAVSYSGMVKNPCGSVLEFCKYL